MANGTPNTRTHHAQFDASDADIVIESADAILFHLHRKNLETHTGAFPGPEFSTQGETVYLTEPAKVLEIIFQFIYPRKHPKLKDLEFETVIAVAEGVEKYEVFSAMNICEVRLREFIPRHAEHVFIHGIKHNYPDLIGEAALLLSCPSSLSLDFLKKLPSHCIIPWIEYHQAFQGIFESAIRYIEGLPYHSGYCDKFADTKDRTPDLCRICRLYLTIWVRELENSDNLSSLKNALKVKNPVLKSKHPKDGEAWCQNCPENKCEHFPGLVKIFEAEIEAIPPFTRFLKPKDVSTT